MVRTSYASAVGFDIKRLGINAGGLLIGAIETTSQAVAQVIEYLNDLARRMGMNRSWVLNTIVYEYAKMMEDKDIGPWLGRFQPQKASKPLEVNS